MALPRVYSLDIIVPASGTVPDHPVVVDFNGMRSSLAHAERSSGSPRLEHSIIRSIADAGGGDIYSLIMRSVPSVTEKFSLSTLLHEREDPVGINRMGEAYVPVGSDFTFADNERTSSIARGLGVNYRTVYADWSSRGFSLSIDNQDLGAFDDWDPKQAAIWPYSWDRRIFPFPRHCRLITPLSNDIITTNKLLLAAVYAKSRTCVDTTSAYPLTKSFGFLTPDTKIFDKISGYLGATSLAVLKPASGRRGFGVIVAPVDQLRLVANAMGLIAHERELRIGSQILAASSLWGGLPDACTVIQPYIQPALRRHPKTGRLHSTVYRATVLAADGRNAECLDVTCMLAKEPYASGNDRIRRSSLVVENNGEIECISPSDEDMERLQSVSERFVIEIESFFASLQSMDDASLLRWECLTTMSYGDTAHDLQVTPVVSEGWQKADPLLSFFAN